MGLICFDLDGTLVDSLGAAHHCAALTFRRYDLPAPSRAAVAASIGLGVGTLFAAEAPFQDPAVLAEALEAYWRHFAQDGIALHRVYDDVPLMLARLKRQGLRLCAVTVQPTRYARQVLHQFDLLLAFDEVSGAPAGPGPAPTKAQALAHLRDQGTLEAGGFLVGDRGEDMAAARANGLTPLGVTYGYGTAEELRAAGAEQLFDTVSDLDQWLERTLAGPEVFDAFARSE